MKGRSSTGVICRKVHTKINLQHRLEGCEVGRLVCCSGHTFEETYDGVTIAPAMIDHYEIARFPETPHIAVDSYDLRTNGVGFYKEMLVRNWI